MAFVQNAIYFALLSEPAPLLVPDRPDLSNGIVIVPEGAAQVEIGGEAMVWPPAPPREALGLVTSVRVGISKRVEVRALESDPLRWLSGTTSDPLVGFGVKARLLETASGSGLGIQPMVQSRPQQSFGHKYLLPGLSLTMIGTHVFGPRAAVDVNVGALFDPLHPAALDTFASASLGVHLHRRVLLFTEVFALREHDPWLHVAPGCDAGVIVAIARWFSVDAAVRGSDLADAPAFTTMAGLTFGWMGSSRKRTPSGTKLRRPQTSSAMPASATTHTAAP